MPTDPFDLEEVYSAAGGRPDSLDGASNAFRGASSGGASSDSSDGCFAGDAYKARPLDGIWATAPYLHNGSVQNLADLLKPESERAATFRVGSRVFDPVNVGFVGDGSFELDTSLEGNRNTDHLWGTDLGDAEKIALLEYLKSLRR